MRPRIPQPSNPTPTIQTARHAKYAKGKGVDSARGLPGRLDRASSPMRSLSAWFAYFGREMKAKRNGKRARLMSLLTTYMGLFMLAKESAAQPAFEWVLKVPGSMDSGS